MKEAVLIVTPGFPADEQDSTCLPAFQQLVLSLQRTAPQLEIVVVSFQYPFEEKRYSWHDATVIALGGKNRGKLFRILTWQKARRALKEVQAAYSLRGIISLFVGECALIATRFARQQKLAHLTWIIGQDAKAGNRYVRRIKPAPKQLVAMSNFLQDEFFKNHGITPAEVIENGINDAGFPPYNARARPIDILGAGSLIPLKNYSLFVELIHELKTSFPSVNAVIAGDGEERELLKTRIEQSGLQKNITLAGLQTHAETLRLMSQSKVFLHTSVYEGNSTVLMEALYSGCQVVSTRPLSYNAVENLFVSENKEELLKKLVTLFSQNAQQKRVVFNTMDHSAARLLALLGKQRP